jgi:hypothetical protein
MTMKMLIRYTNLGTSTLLHRVMTTLRPPVVRPRPSHQAKTGRTV